MKIFIPIVLVSPNVYEHWSKRYARNQKIRSYLMAAVANIKLPIPCRVFLTRHGMRKFDYDNLVAAFKGVRDQVASLIIPGLKPGRADGDDRISWYYDQITDKKKGVSIEIVAS